MTVLALKLAAEYRAALRLVYNFKHKRWVIRYQWRRDKHLPVKPGEQESWRHRRHFGVVPVLFRTEKAAQDYLETVGFANMRHCRKASASISVKWLPERASP